MAVANRCGIAVLLRGSLGHINPKNKTLAGIRIEGHGLRPKHKGRQWACLNGV